MTSIRCILVFLATLTLIGTALADDVKVELGVGESATARLQIHNGGLVARVADPAVAGATIDGRDLVIVGMSEGTTTVQLERGGRRLATVEVTVHPPAQTHSVTMEVGDSVVLDIGEHRFVTGTWHGPMIPEGIVALERINAARPGSSLTPDLGITGLAPGTTRFVVHVATTRGVRRVVNHLVVAEVRARPEPAAVGFRGNILDLAPRRAPSVGDHAAGGCGTARTNFGESPTDGLLGGAGRPAGDAPADGTSVGPTGNDGEAGCGTAAVNRRRFPRMQSSGGVLRLQQEHGVGGRTLLRAPESTRRRTAPAPQLRMTRPGRASRTGPPSATPIAPAGGSAAGRLAR